MNELIAKLSVKDERYAPFARCNGNGFFDGIEIVPNNAAATSLRFAGEPEQAIVNAFGITDPSFHEKIRQVRAGDGHEYARISTLHSSALLALLFFHGVGRDNPIRFQDERSGGTVPFTEAGFEHKNPIPNNPRPSNIDVVLRNEERNVTFFLESKYSEYLVKKKMPRIPTRVYGDIFRRLEPALGEIGLTMQFSKDGSSFDLCADMTHTESIKQMVAHWLGAVQYAETHPSEDVWLGEVFFFFRELEYDVSTDYQWNMHCLAEALNSLKKPDNLRLLPEVLSYDDIIKDNPDYVIPERVAEYYGFRR